MKEFFYRDEEKIEEQLPVLPGQNSAYLPVIAQGAKVNSSPAGYVQTRAEGLFLKFLFIGSKNDGLLETTGGGGSTARYLMTTEVISVGTSTSTLQSSNFSTSSYAQILWDNSFEFFVTALVLGEQTTYDIFIGIFGGASASTIVPADGLLTTRHIGFFIYNDLVYASNADGVTQARSLITGVNFDYPTTTPARVYNIYRFEYEAGKEIRFYINDVFVAKHTTFLPSGSSQIPLIYLGVAGKATGKTLVVGNNYSVLVKK